MAPLTNQAETESHTTGRGGIGALTVNGTSMNWTAHLVECDRIRKINLISWAKVLTMGAERAAKLRGAFPERFSSCPSPPNVIREESSKK